MTGIAGHENLQFYFSADKQLTDMVDGKKNLVFLELGLNTIFPEVPFHRG